MPVTAWIPSANSLSADAPGYGYQRFCSRPELCPGLAIAAEAIVLWVDSAISVGANCGGHQSGAGLNGMSQWIMWK